MDRADIWESDEELAQFLADTYRARRGVDADLVAEAASRLADVAQKLEDGRRYYGADAETWLRWSDREIPTLVHDVIPNILLLLRQALDAGTRAGEGEARPSVPATTDWRATK